MMDFIVLDLRDRIRERENFENRIKGLKTENKNMKKRFKQSNNKVKKDNKVLRKEVERLTKLLEDKVDEKSIEEYEDKIKNNEIETFSHDEVKEEVFREGVEEKERGMFTTTMHDLIMFYLNKKKIHSQQDSFVNIDIFLSDLCNRGFMIRNMNFDPNDMVNIEIQFKEDACYKYNLNIKSIDKFNLLDLKRIDFFIDFLN